MPDRDWREEWRETIFNIFRSLKFIVSVLLEIVTAAVIVLGIRSIQLIVTPELKIGGWEIHHIALIFEEAVLVGFFVSSLIKHFGHLFEGPIARLGRLFRWLADWWRDWWNRP